MVIGAEPPSGGGSRPSVRGVRHARVVVAALLWCDLVGLELAGIPPAARFAVALLVGASLAALPRAAGPRAIVAALALLVAVQWYGVPIIDRPNASAPGATARATSPKRAGATASSTSAISRSCAS